MVWRKCSMWRSLCPALPTYYLMEDQYPLSLSGDHSSYSGQSQGPHRKWVGENEFSSCTIISVVRPVSYWPKYFLWSQERERDESYFPSTRVRSAGTSNSHRKYYSLNQLGQDHQNATLPCILCSEIIDMPCVCRGCRARSPPMTFSIDRYLIDWWVMDCGWIADACNNSTVERL